VPYSEGEKKWRRAVVDRPEYTQYEDGLKIILWPYNILGRELFHLWTKSGVFIGCLAYRMALNFASYEPAEFSKGLKALIEHCKGNPSWNEEPATLWKFIRDGGLGKFLKYPGPIEGEQPDLEEELNLLITLSDALEYRNLPSLLGRSICCPQDAAGAASQHAEGPLSKAEFSKLLPKPASKKLKGNSIGNVSSSQSDEAKKAALEILMEKLLKQNIKREDRTDAVVTVVPEDLSSEELEGIQSNGGVLKYANVNSATDRELKMSKVQVREPLYVMFIIIQYFSVVELCLG